MALSIVNVGIPALSWKKRLASNSRFGKAGISRPVPSPIPRICNSLQANGQPIRDEEVLLSVAESEEYGNGHKPHKSFPTQFYFGAASSAFQVEGSTKEGGRGPSIWDTFCEKYPNKIAGGANGEPGAGSYKYYKRDVQLLVNMGVNAYRFSISWARVLPNGRVPNEEGIAYYNNLINELKANNIEPFVTLFHWDMPQTLEDEYGGFLSRRVVKDFKTFAKLCFDRFGDRVKHWTTLNEPSMFSEMGYSRGLSAPGHCTPDLYPEDSGYSCPTGDSLREPYIVGHNLLLAHAEAVDLYRSEYKTKYGGEVGITLCSMWYEPYNSLPHNKEAAQRALDFSLGWFLDPLKFGRYPFSMRALVGDRLPILTPEESKKIKNSFDFIGFNYYSARYARDKSDFNHTHKPKTSGDDSQVSILVESGGIPIGPSEKDSWVYVYPKGLRKILLYIKDRYDNPPIYITENGVFQLSSVKPDYRPEIRKLGATIDDLYRIEFHTSHLQELEEVISNKAQVKGYFVWSLLDSFEWVSGYSLRFGLNHVSYDNMPNPDLTRTPKQSAHWYADYIKSIRNGKALQPKLFEKAMASLVVRGDP